MANKKIAVFASGWYAQNLAEYISGMEEVCKENNTDIFLFIAYPPTYEYKDILKSELNIFNLPDLSDFDGISIISSSISFPEYLNALFEKCKASGVPTISHGVSYEGLYTSMIDNKAGMKDLCVHMLEKHGIKNPAFIAGSDLNEESNIRFETLKEAMQERNLSFNEDFLCYTSWDNLVAVNFAKELYEKGTMPDAFICGNDGLAMSVTMALSEVGVDVPSDVLVTGFDYLFDSQFFYPCISSVNQEFKALGANNASVLLELANGKTFDETTFSVPCKFIPGESCGCFDVRDSNRIRQIAGRKAFMSRVNDNLIDRTLTTFERELFDAQDLDDLKTRFQVLVSIRQILDIDSCHIILDNAAFEEGNKIGNALKNGFSEKNPVLFSMVDNNISYIRHTDRHELVPGYTGKDSPRLYSFASLYESDNVLGYIVVEDRLDLIDSRLLQKYQSRLGVMLQNFRQNVNLTFINGQLVKQARKDALTHVQNRSAYESDVKRYENFVKNKEKVNFAVAMFDINNLKDINDKLGHDAGDEYILSCCRLICNTFNNSPVYRIGGDEFLTILVGNDYQNREVLLNGFKEIMESYKNDIHLPATKLVSIASGMSEYTPEDEDFQQIFKRADKLMYENKIAMKGEGNVR